MDEPSPTGVEGARYAQFETALKTFVEPKKYNRGLNTDREFEYKSNKYTAPAVKVWDRPEFLHQSDLNGVTDYSIMDVDNLRQADLALDPRRKSSADFLLNNVGQACVDFIEEFNHDNQGKTVRFCRYGGDEFAFSYSGISKEEIIEVNKKLSDKIRDMPKGFYLRDGKHVTAQLTHVTFTDTSRPGDDDQLGQVIFSHYIGENVILNKEDLEKLKSNFEGVHEFRQWEGKQKLKEFYPKSYSIDDKLKFLSRVNPVLNDDITKLIDLAAKAGTDAKIRLMSELQDMYIDPLLRRPMLDAADLINNITEGNVSRVFTKDLKYLKELNNLSYAEADNAIKTLWDHVALSIGNGDMDKLIISRNGGSIQIGVKAGKALSAETLVRLATLESIDVTSEFTGETVNLPIGSHDHDVDPAFLSKKYSKGKTLNENEQIQKINLMEKEKNQLFRESDRSFFARLAMQVMHPVAIDKKGEKLTLVWDRVFPHNATIVEGYSQDSINHNYFVGKRAAQRLDYLLRALDDANLDNAIAELKITLKGVSMPKERIRDLMFEARRKLMEKIQKAGRFAYQRDMADAENLSELSKKLSSL